MWNIYIKGFILQASGPKDILYGVDLRAYSSQDRASLQILLTKLRTEHTGLTVWKMLNIDRHTVLTVSNDIGLS